MPPSPKSQAYVSGVSPSASVAVPVNATVTGAVPVAGVADAVTAGGALSVTPRPRKSTQLTLNSEPPSPPTGLRATKYSGPLSVPAAAGRP